MTKSELELAENLANEKGEWDATDRRLMRLLLEERERLVKALELLGVEVPCDC